MKKTGGQLFEDLRDIWKFKEYVVCSGKERARVVFPQSFVEISLSYDLGINST